MYDNAGDANRYLSGTVAYWDGDPVYIFEVTNRQNDAGRRIIMAYVCKIPMGGQLEFWIDINDAKFNCMKYQLGYCNSKEYGAIYVSRRPARIQSQGICGANLSAKGLADGLRGRDIFGHLTRDPGFVDMLTGKYPTADEARKMLEANPKIKAVAFSPTLCFKRHPRFSNLLFLGYKGDDVAYSDSGEFTLPEEYHYLRETCQPKGCLKAA